MRVKAKQEQAAYQASLRKEQMKVDSLERTLEQKVSGEMYKDMTSGIFMQTNVYVICIFNNCFTEQRN